MGYNIMLVDEIGITRIELSNILKSIQVTIIPVRDAMEAMNVLCENKAIHAILWSVNSMDIWAFDEVKTVKTKDQYKHIPVIIVSKYTDKKYIVKAIEVGAVEFIAKPFDEETVIKKVCEVMGITEGKPNSSKNKLEDSISYSLEAMLSREMKGATRGNYCLSLILVEVKLKTEMKFNENDIIQILYKMTQKKIRETDSIFMYGENCILVILSYTSREGAAVVEKKIRSIYETHSTIKQKKASLIFGTAVVSYPQDGKMQDQLLEKLEKSLHEQS